MSELQDPKQQDPELEELERRLSAAFGGTRPRRGFQDELWARIKRRRGPRLASWRLRTWSALGALAAILVIGLGVLAVPRLASSSPAGVAKQAQPSASAPQTPGRAAHNSADKTRPQSAETAGDALERNHLAPVIVAQNVRPITLRQADERSYLPQSRLPNVPKRTCVDPKCRF